MKPRAISSQQLEPEFMKGRHRGSVAAVVGSLIVGIVFLYIGLFMVDTVSNATALTNTSTFWTVQTNLITQTSTIFTVMGLVLIVVALAAAIQSLRRVAE